MRRALGASYLLMATSGWAPSLYPSASFFTPLFLTSSERPWESGESSPVGYLSCSTSTFISSQRPVLAAQEKIRVEKTQRSFLSSGGHLDIYRDLVHNHFNICECLLRESKRVWGQVFLPVSFRSRSYSFRENIQGPRLEMNFRHKLPPLKTNITINDSISL